ncbi:MAG: hypothetical protein P8X70_00430 [Nanoarchaeota archaeon]
MGENLEENKLEFLKRYIGENKENTFDAVMLESFYNILNNKESQDVFVFGTPKRGLGTIRKENLPSFEGEVEVRDDCFNNTQAVYKNRKENIIIYSKDSCRSPNDAISSLEFNIRLCYSHFPWIADRLPQIKNF